MKAAFTTRRATPADSDTVLAMMNEIAGAEAVGTVDVTPARWRELMQRDDLIVFLAEREGAAIGYVSAVITLKPWLGGEIVALDDLYVRPGQRDGGVGRELMRAVAALAAPDELIVRWEVENDNIAAQRFYARLGATLRSKTIAAWRPSACRQWPSDDEEPGAARRTRAASIGRA